MTASKKTLIIGPAWVGDMVMAQTLFCLLKQREPDVQIDVLAPAWTKPLLHRMPEVSEAIDAPFGHGQMRLRDRYRLGVDLRSRGYDRAIVLPNSFKSALVPFAAKIRRRTGWVGEMRYGLLNDVRRLKKQQLPLMAERFVALGLEKEEALPGNLPRPALHSSSESVSHSLQRVGLSQPERPVLGLCPGAEFGASKRWPAEYYAEVANNKLANGWGVWLFGSMKERVIADQINALTDHRCVNLAGTTQLNEAIDLLSLVDAVVTNDSGLMHIAAALGRPLVAVYGSTSPKFTPPLLDRVKILSLALDCSPCFERECPLKHNKCMRDLKPMQVIEGVNALL